MISTKEKPSASASASVKNKNSTTTKNKAALKSSRLTSQVRRQIEKKVAFCLSNLFYFEPELVAQEGDYVSTAERDAAPKPRQLGLDVLPPLRVDVKILPETILIPAGGASIWGEIHPFISLPVNLVNGYQNLSYVEQLILTHRFGLKRSPDEIATALGYPRTRVYEYLSQAILKLAPYILELGVELASEIEAALEVEAGVAPPTPLAQPGAKQSSNTPADRNKKLGKFFYLKTQAQV